jgi:hypothetical protein
VQIKGGLQKMVCADMEGIFRIIQSVSSPKAEPFKLWLARIGKERLEEIANPELAVTRAKELYEKKGYDKSWIDKRMRGIAVRNTLTDEWKNRGAKGSDYAILTDEIYKATFDKTSKEYMDHKSLDKKAGDNLRDHMGDIELILTTLGEATTTELSTTKDSKGIAAFKIDLPGAPFSLYALSLGQDYRLKDFNFPEVDGPNQIELLTHEEVLTVCNVLCENHTHWLTPPNPRYNGNNRFTYRQPYWDDCPVYKLETIKDPLGAYYFSKYVVVGKIKK